MDFIAANPTKAVEKIRREVLKASKAVRKAKDVKKMITLKQQLELAKIEEVQKASVVQILDKPLIPLGPSNKKLRKNMVLSLCY